MKLMNLMRPGYNPPNHHDVGGKLLDEVRRERESLVEECKQKLEKQSVSMSLDGWSNVHNEPVVCVTVTIEQGETFLTSSIDTSGNSHTADYLTEVAKEAVKSCEREYGCRVRSFVTDNKANVAKMREQLRENEDLNLITYGCSAHLLNLLAHDVQVQACKENIVKVIKYFRNVHLAAARYKAAGGSKLVLPSDVLMEHHE